MRAVVIGFHHLPGGTRTAYLGFLAFLLENKFEVGAVSIADIEEWVPTGLKFHESVPFTRGYMRYRKVLHLVRAMYRCKRFKPDVLICIGLTSVGNIISFSLGPKCFRICQDVIFGRDPLDRNLLKALRSFDAIAPQAPSMVKELRRKGFRGAPMRWLPCYPERPFTGISANLGRERPIRLGYFGRLEPHKGLDLLINAVASECRQDELRLDIWGTGNSERYKSLADGLDVSSQIRFPGAYPPGREGAQVIAGYDALALTSLGNEGLPLILLEGMAYGLPLLTTSVASIPDCCADNPDAIMVEPTIGAIRAGLRTVITRLDEGSFSSMRIQQFYRDRFSHEAMSRRWLECLSNPFEFFAVHE
jgi:glycosyltransferase involved in cell wall biosynthesis